jgi:hypothetical protein
MMKGHTYRIGPEVGDPARYHATFILARHASVRGSVGNAPHFTSRQAFEMRSSGHPFAYASLAGCQ